MSWLPKDSGTPQVLPSAWTAGEGIRHVGGGVDQAVERHDRVRRRERADMVGDGEEQVGLALGQGGLEEVLAQRLGATDFLLAWWRT